MVGHGAALVARSFQEGVDAHERKGSANKAPGPGSPIYVTYIYIGDNQLSCRAESKSRVAGLPSEKSHTPLRDPVLFT